MKKTYQEIREADELVASLYKKNPALEKGKLGYAWTKIIKKNYNPILEEIADKIIDNRVENALSDPNTKELLIGADKNYKYSKEGMKSLLEANRKLSKEYDKKEIEIIPYFVKKEELPELSKEDKDLLRGLIIE